MLGLTGWEKLKEMDDIWGIGLWSNLKIVKVNQCTIGTRPRLK